MKAAGLVAGTEPTVADLVPAIEADLIEADDQACGSGTRWSARRSTSRADVAARHAAHAALAEVLTDDPDRQAWHRAAAAAGPTPPSRPTWRRPLAVPAAAAASSPPPPRSSAPPPSLPTSPAAAPLLLRAADAASELGHTDLVTRLLAEVGTRPHPLTPHDRAYALSLGDAFGAEPVGDPLRVRALIEAARQLTAGKGKDPGLALGLLSAAAFRCHWAGLGAAGRGRGARRG